MLNTPTGLLIFLLLATSAAPAVAGGDGWTEVADDGGITIYDRTRPGSDVKELRAIGVIDAPPWACMNVVSDEARFEEFMPYNAESRILQGGEFERVVYERIRAPFVSDRDYTLAVRDVSTRRADGKVLYEKRWSTANARGPAARDGVVRLEIVEGFWRFEEVDGGKQTLATYYVYTDPGGSLPLLIVNWANKQAIPRLFEAVARQAKEPRYTKQAPDIPGDAGDAADSAR